MWHCGLGESHGIRETRDCPNPMSNTSDLRAVRDSHLPP
jgi:hypothetical protein